MKKGGQSDAASNEVSVVPGGLSRTDGPQVPYQEPYQVPGPVASPGRTGSQQMKTPSREDASREGASGRPARRRGRPPAFDRETVLHQAMLTFWKLGYEGASIADLTAAMGITPQSLYAAFGSKSGLYREVLAHYQRVFGAASVQALEQPSALAGFTQMLRRSATAFSRPDLPRGCMVSTATLRCAREHQAEADHVAALRNAAVAMFERRIRAAIAADEFRPDTDAAALARFIGAMIQGMSIQAQDGATEEELLALAEVAVGLLDEKSV